jgi:sterol desaturase/sphingolipid hydroxylase (fatty acid hydroxylase superfamily)
MPAASAISPVNRTLKPPRHHGSAPAQPILAGSLAGHWALPTDLSRPSGAGPLERITDGLLNIVRHAGEVLFSVGSEFSLTSLACALAVAIGFFTARRLKRRGRTRLARFARALMRGLFPKRILRHVSTKADIGYFLFNTFVYAGIFGMAAVSYQFLTNGVLRGLIAAAGPVAPSALPELAQRAIVTAMLFLAYEFGYWLDHYLKHRVPVLWELHKVHHSAEVLTPLTSFRIHPLDTFMFGNILAVTAALTNGACAYLFGDTTYQYVLSGNNIVLVLFIHLYVHLQHTHVWIAFRGVLGRLFVSPAHHQIHHSTNPVHFNKNLGSCLAVWDWLFGTLHVPAREREKLSFGVAPVEHGAHTITGEFLAPFGRAFNVLVGPLRRRPAIAAESPPPA